MAPCAFGPLWGHADSSRRWLRDRKGGWLWSWRDLRHHAAVVLLDQDGLPSGQAARVLGHGEKVLIGRMCGPQEDAIDKALKATA